MNTSSNATQSTASIQAPANDVSLPNASPKDASSRDVVDIINSYVPWMKPDGTVHCKLPLSNGGNYTCPLSDEIVEHRVNATLFDRGQVVDRKKFLTAISVVHGKLDENRSTSYAVPGPLLQVVVVFAKNEKEWTGNASTLLAELEKLLPCSDRQSLNLGPDTLARRLLKMQWDAKQHNVQITQLARTKLDFFQVKRLG